MKNHIWFYSKGNYYRCCKRCGVIENKKNINKECKGKVEVELRSK